MPPSASTELRDGDQQYLLGIARKAMMTHLEKQTFTHPEPEPKSPLGQRRGVFVTLKKAGLLRGCIGVINAGKPLLEEVIDCARGAAFRDPRFPPLSSQELLQAQISIAVLSPPTALVADSREALEAVLRPKRDGVIIEQGKHRATFLPQVWEQLPSTTEFVSRLLLKAGLPENHWSPDIRCSRYESFSFAEPDPHNPGLQGPDRSRPG